MSVISISYQLRNARIARRLAVRFRLLMGLLLTAVILATSTPLASAHILKLSNGVRAVMHIAPFDDPAANEKTRIEFMYGSDSSTFSLTNYRVGYTVALANKTLVTGDSPPAYFGAAQESIADVTFPKLGVYTLTLTGTPTNTTAPDFQMTYDIRVDHAATAATVSQPSKTPLIILAGAGGVIAIGFILSWQISRRVRVGRKNK